MSAYIRTDYGMTVFFDDGSEASIEKSNRNFDAVIAAIGNKDWDKVKTLMIPAEHLSKMLEENNTGTDITNKVRIEHGCVYYNDKPLHSTLTKRMVEMVCEYNIDVTPMARFLENLMENPSYRAVNELYDFLEVSNLPITEDGHFIAYKRITKDWKDCHTQSVDNSIGQVVEMPRNEVNEDKNETCSTGLHFCARNYLKHYGSYDGGGRVVVVKINPRDVVSVPVDYNNAKGRCCRYEVVQELKLDHDAPHALPTENLEGAFRSNDFLHGYEDDRCDYDSDEDDYNDYYDDPEDHYGFYDDEEDEHHEYELDDFEQLKVTANDFVCILADETDEEKDSSSETSSSQHKESDDSTVPETASTTKKSPLRNWINLLSGKY